MFSLRNRVPWGTFAAEVADILDSQQKLYSIIFFILSKHHTDELTHVNGYLLHEIWNERSSFAV